MAEKAKLVQPGQYQIFSSALVITEREENLLLHDLCHLLHLDPFLCTASPLNTWKIWRLSWFIKQFCIVYLTYPV